MTENTIVQFVIFQKGVPVDVLAHADDQRYIRMLFAEVCDILPEIPVFHCFFERFFPCSPGSRIFIDKRLRLAVVDMDDIVIFPSVSKAFFIMAFSPAVEAFNRHIFFRYTAFRACFPEKLFQHLYKFYDLPLISIQQQIIIGFHDFRMSCICVTPIALISESDIIGNCGIKLL